MTQYDQLIDQWLQGNEGAAEQHLRDIIVTTAAGIYESQSQTPSHKPGFPPGYDPEAEFDKLMQQQQELARLQAQRDAENREEERIYKLPKNFYPDRVDPDGAPFKMPLPQGTPMYPKFTPGLHREINIEDRKEEYQAFGQALDRIEKMPDTPLSGLSRAQPSVTAPSVTAPSLTPQASEPRAVPKDPPYTGPAPEVPRNEPGINKKFIENDEIDRIKNRYQGQLQQQAQARQQEYQAFGQALDQLDKMPKPRLRADTHPDDLHLKVTPGYTPKGPLPTPGLRRDFEESRANSRKKSS